MYDVNSVIQAQTTQTATFDGTGFNLGTRTPLRGMMARFLFSNIQSGVTAGSVFTPIIKESVDNTTFTILSEGAPITAGTAAAGKEVFVPVNTVNKYICASISVTSQTGSTPTASYLVDLGISRP